MDVHRNDFANWNSPSQESPKTPAELRQEQADALAFEREQAKLTAEYQEEIAAAERAKQAERDRERGYSVNRKAFFMSYGVECVVIATTLTGEGLLTLQTDGDTRAHLVMMLAPVGYAAVEFCRVPLALLVRMHRQWTVRAVLALFMIAPVGLTVKSMSLLGTLLYAPREAKVRIAYEQLGRAEADAKEIAQKITVADAHVAQLRDDEKRAIDNDTAVVDALKNLPPSDCRKFSGINRHTGQGFSTTKCTPDPRGKPLENSLNAAGNTAKSVHQAYEKAFRERQSLDPAAADKAVADARLAYREAVRNSPLHDLASQLFGVDPEQVDNALIARLKRLLVFGGALCVALASTMIAFAAVTRLKPVKSTEPARPDKPGTLPLDARHWDISLGHFKAEAFKRMASGNKIREEFEQELARTAGARAAEKPVNDAVNETNGLQNPPPPAEAPENNIKQDRKS